MKNRFRFKSLMLALLMAVMPIFGAVAQNPFVTNVSAVEGKVESKTGEPELASQVKRYEAELSLADNKKVADKKIDYALISKKSLACLGWFVVGFAGAIPIALLGGLAGALTAIPFVVINCKIGFIIGGIAGALAGAMPSALKIVENIDGIILAIKG